MRERQPWRSSVSPFQNTCPSASIATCTLSGLVTFGALEALGRSTFTACVSSGAVMMKITSSTSITSISGIMLISAIGVVALPRCRSPKAISGLRRRRLERHHGAGFRRGARGKEGEEVVREAVEACEQQAVGAHERVVGENRGDRDRQADGGHDQRFAHRSRDLVERALTGKTDGNQRVIHAPDGPEQADEGRGRAHRGK